MILSSHPWGELSRYCLCANRKLRSVFVVLLFCSNVSGWYRGVSRLLFAAVVFLLKKYIHTLPHTHDCMHAMGGIQCGSWCGFYHSPVNDRAQWRAFGKQQAPQWMDPMAYSHLCGTLTINQTNPIHQMVCGLCTNGTQIDLKLLLDESSQNARAVSFNGYQANAEIPYLSETNLFHMAHWDTA